MTDQKLRELCEAASRGSWAASAPRIMGRFCLKLLAEKAILEGQRDAMRRALTYARAFLVSMGRGEENAYSLCLRNLDKLVNLDAVGGERAPKEHP